MFDKLNRYAKFSSFLSISIALHLFLSRPTFLFLSVCNVSPTYFSSFSLLPSSFESISPSRSLPHQSHFLSINLSSTAVASTTISSSLSSSPFLLFLTHSVCHSYTLSHPRSLPQLGDCYVAGTAFGDIYVIRYEAG